MKKELITLLLLLSIIALPMLTSLLLQLQFIQAYTVRQVLIHILMAIEMLIQIIILLQYINKK